MIQQRLLHAEGGGGFDWNAALGAVNAVAGAVTAVAGNSSAPPLNSQQVGPQVFFLPAPGPQSPFLSPTTLAIGGGVVIIVVMILIKVLGAR